VTSFTSPWRWRLQGPPKLVSYHNTTRRHNPENRDLNLHRHENLKSGKTVVAFIMSWWRWARKLKAQQWYRLLVTQLYTQAQDVTSSLSERWTWRFWIWLHCDHRTQRIHRTKYQQEHSVRPEAMLNLWCLHHHNNGLSYTDWTTSWATAVRFPEGTAILLAIASRPALGPIQPSHQWVPRVLTPG